MFKKLALLFSLFTLSFCQLNPIVEGKKLVQVLSMENFEFTVQKGNKLPYFVFFKMTRCGHCKMFEPTFYKLAFDLRDKPITFGINNVDDDSE